MDKLIVFLTNRMPSYRVSTFNALGASATNFEIWLSQPAVESALPTHDLRIKYQRSIVMGRPAQQPSVCVDDPVLHIPLDTIPRLWCTNPRLIVVSEMGARALQTVLYKIVRRSVKLIVHADLSERTERNRGFVRRYLRKIILAFADAVLVNGASGARYIQSYGYRVNKIFTIPYATDTITFPEVRRSPGQADPKKFLYVGRLVEGKGLIQMIESMDHWFRHNPTRSGELHIVGDGPLRERILQFKPANNFRIEFRDWVSYRNLSTVYAKADIFVFPTLADTWGMVVNEALASSLPVLGSIHSQAAEELIRDGVNGWLYDPELPNSLPNALDRAYAVSDSDLHSMRAAARKAALQIDPVTVANSMVAVFNATLDNAAPELKPI
ncbi:MAG: glycosyltransferase family 4 protein [Gammaproteobacteria bacterium]|nr:glycosyltransferase family 4 protein [Gammaproteobacteria bacterium]